MNLNTKEKQVLQILGNTAQDIAGGDFGCMDEVDYAPIGLNAQEFGGYVTALSEKDLIDVAEPHRVNNEGPAIIQYTLREEAWEIWNKEEEIQKKDKLIAASPDSPPTNLVYHTDSVEQRAHVRRMVDEKFSIRLLSFCNVVPSTKDHVRDGANHLVSIVKVATALNTGVKWIPEMLNVYRILRIGDITVEDIKEAKRLGVMEITRDKS